VRPDCRQWSENGGVASENDPHVTKKWISSMGNCKRYTFVTIRKNAVTLLGAKRDL
jgi:hypothetical protein